MGFIERAVNVVQHILLGMVAVGIFLVAFAFGWFFFKDPVAFGLFLAWFAQSLCWLFHEAADYARMIRSEPNEWRRWWEIFIVPNWTRGQREDFYGPVIGVAVMLIFGYWVMVWLLR